MFANMSATSMLPGVTECNLTALKQQTDGELHGYETKINVCLPYFKTVGIRDSMLFLAAMCLLGPLSWKVWIESYDS